MKLDTSVVFLLHTAAEVYCTSLIHVHNYLLRKEQVSVKFILFANVCDQSGTVEKTITWMQTVQLVSAYDNNKNTTLR